MRTGRPIVKRNRKALLRDIATLKRLRRAIELDGRIDGGRARSVIAGLSLTIDTLSDLQAQYP